jgi:metal-sulfur cluster biosynthetic enzyme
MKKDILIFEVVKIGFMSMNLTTVYLIDSIPERSLGFINDVACLGKGNSLSTIVFITIIMTYTACYLLR